MLERLLDYWYSIEFFQPSWPVKEKKHTDLFKQPLPWLTENTIPTIHLNYDIYFGKAIAFDLIVWALGRLKLTVEDTPIARDQSKVCLCALKVDEHGAYVADSFAVSSFIWALGVMVQANDFNTKLNLNDMEALQSRFNTALSEKEAPFSFKKLQDLFIQVSDELGIENGIISPSLWACQKIQRCKKDGTFPPLDPATELMNSYYVQDIAKIKKEPDQRVQRYVQALYDAPPKRTMIDSDIPTMQQWLEADRFPRGTWPSTYSPSLMQQLAINLAISGQNMFSVNGPPGTGKTTLLKEIVASNIVQRAILLAKYEKPDDAFRKERFNDPPDQYNSTFYQPDHALTAFGMLVASNNNAAVENISVELPKMFAKDRTGHFTHIENLDETYFADIATALLGEPAWGLISARLGKNKNLNAFKERLWWTKEGPTLKQYYEGAAPDWGAAREAFHAALAKVEEERASIAAVQKLLVLHALTVEKEQSQLTEVEKYSAEAEEHTLLYERQSAALKALEETHLLQRQNADMLKASLSWFKRLLPKLFKKDLVICEWKRTDLSAGETLVAITRQRTVLQNQARALDAARLELAQQEAALQKIREERRRIEALLEPEKKRFGVNFADEAFWRNISANERSQSACPWTGKAYDTLREELFFQALMLQKAFVLNSNGVKQNLSRLFVMWSGGFSKESREAAYGCLLNTLFFVVPVISTTFASVHNFLDGVQPGELGVLVVDEAGQATPQSALGALWRTSKAIVVGDPLQVEPIITTPLELRQRFAQDNALPAEYRMPELSVQMLADAQNPFGGLRKMGDAQLWLGCPLVIHRRCIEPMFSISNQVAYNGRMFCKTAQPAQGKAFLLEKSTWFDVPGEEIGNKDHTVHQQIDLVARLMERAVLQANGLPDLYIITPFTSVKSSLERKLSPLLKRLLPKMDVDDIDDWIDESCGTIHTFQGKEANEVLLVLGCDDQKGMGAARWVGQKPNIINVAVSRAKYRIGVIGSHALWRRIPYVQMVCEVLKPERATGV